MKAALCFVSLAVLAGVITAASTNAPYGWDLNTAYTYRVQSRFAAGMLGLDGPTVDDTETARAIVELNYKIVVYKTSPNEISMNPFDFKAVIAKEEIDPREEPISSQTEVAIPQKYQDLLEKVMIVKLNPNSGVPDSFVVRGSQPLSATEKNIKRAQVQVFILNPGTDSLIIQGNLNRQSNSVRQSEQDDDSGFFYKVMEESIHGECQTYYHVSQTGPFQSMYHNEAQDVPSQADQGSDSDSNEERKPHPRFSYQQQQQSGSSSENEINDDAQKPWPQAFQQYCDNDHQIYIIQKTVNLTACRDRPVLATIMPPELLDCRPGDNSCGSLWNHVVNTRFLACGSSREDFTIIEVNQEERFVYGLRADENIDGLTVKNVTLEEKQESSSDPNSEEMKNQGDKEYQVKSLVFEFDLNEQQKQLGGQQQQQWQQQQQEDQQQQQQQQDQPQQEQEPQQQNSNQQLYRNWKIGHEDEQQQQSQQQGPRQQNSNWQQSSGHHGSYSYQSNRDGNHHHSNRYSDSDEYAPQGTYGPIQFPLRNQQPSLEAPPLRPQLITTVVSQQQLQQRALDLLQEAAENIQDPSKSIPEGETISLQSVLAKTLRYMSKEQQIQLYQQALEQNKHDPALQNTVENILTDAMAASGTNPSLVALFELIEQGSIDESKGTQLVMTFAHYARHPTLEFFERFEEFIKSQQVQNHNGLRTTSLLSFSTLLNQACVDSRMKETSLSYALYGPFCQPEDTLPFVNQAIKQLQKALSKEESEFQEQGRSKSHEISLQLTILGNVGHPKIIKAVQQILDDSNDVQEKSKAIYALRKLMISHQQSSSFQYRHGNYNLQLNQNDVDRIESDPITDNVVEKKVLPLLVSVALDKTEHPTVRSVAIQELVYCTFADVTIWQQLAMATWFETSQDVHNFIHTTISNLADLEVAPTRLHQKMIIKARSVLPLLKPLDDENIGRSTNTFASGNVQHLNSQFFRQLSWLGSRDSSLPTSVYFRNLVTFGSGAVGVNPIEAVIHFRTFQQVFGQVYEQLGSSSSEESGEKNEYMQKILENIVPREMEEDPKGSVFINFRNGMQRLWEIEDLDQYLSVKAIKQYAALRHGIPFNYQKTIQLAHQTMDFPTIMGLTGSFKLRVPVMISLQGEAKLNAGSDDAQFHAQIDAVAGYKRHVKISVKIPYLQRKIESGIQSHFVAQIPLRISIRQRSDEPIVIAITPTADINGTRPTGKIELATYHRHPYIAVVTDELYPTVYNKGGQMTVIRTIDNPTTSENTMKNVLGFSVQTQHVSDYREEKEAQSGWTQYLSDFQDAETYAHLGSNGGQVAKYVNRKAVLNTDESQSKTLVFLIAAKRGSGSTEQGFDTDVSSSSSSSSSTSESDDSDSSDSSSSSSEEAQRSRRQVRQANNQESSSSSSSSSSSETNEASNSNENSAEVLKKGRLIVLAVLTKKEEVQPVSHSSGSGLSNLLKADNANQQQFIVQLSKRTDKFFLRYAQGSAAEDAARSLPSDSNSVQKLATAVIDPDYTGQQAEFCSEVSAKIQYPKFAHPRLIIALRDTLLSNELNVEVQALAQFAHTCKDEDLKQNEISVSGQLQRGQNMTEWAKSKSPEAQQCEEDESRGFFVSKACLTVANEQAAGLDNARLTIQWSDDLPEALQQAVYDARDIAKAVYMQHAYHDRFPQNPATGNSAIVRLQISPDGEYWSAVMLTNETELQINDVPSSYVLQAAFPLSAVQSVLQNLKDSFFGDDSQPTCQLQGKTISSFDNVVGEIDTDVADDCYHLLTADGSGEDSMAILAKNIGTDNMKLKLVLSQTNIQLASQRTVSRSRLAAVQSATDISAIVNGQVVTLPFTVRKAGQRTESNDYVARILPHPSGGVQVLTPKNDIAFDGERVVVFIDESYRNKTVGLCGDFDGEKVADRRSRKDIPLSDVTLLYANYAYDGESNQCKVKQPVEQQIKQEESLAEIRRDTELNNQRQSRSRQQKVWQNRQTDSSSSSSEESSQDNASRLACFFIRPRPPFCGGGGNGCFGPYPRPPGCGGGGNNNNQNNANNQGGNGWGWGNNNNQANQNNQRSSNLACFGPHPRPPFCGGGGNNNNQNNGNNQGGNGCFGPYPRPPGCGGIGGGNNNNQNNGNNQGGNGCFGPYPRPPGCGGNGGSNNNQNNGNNQGGNSWGNNNNNQNNGNNQGGNGWGWGNDNNQSNQNNQRSSNNQNNGNNQGGNGGGNNNNQGNQNNQRSSDLACSGPLPRPPHCGGGGNNNNQNNGNNQGGNGGGNNNNQGNQNNQRSSDLACVGPPPRPPHCGGGGNNNNQNNGNNQGGNGGGNNNNQNNQNNQRSSDLACFGPYPPPHCGGGGNNNNQNNGNNQGGNGWGNNNNNQNNQNNQRSSNNQNNGNNQGGNGGGNNNNQGNQNNQRSSDLACFGPYPRPPHCGGGGNNNNQNNGNNQGGGGNGGNNNNQNNQNNQRKSNFSFQNNGQNGGGLVNGGVNNQNQNNGVNQGDLNNGGVNYNNQNNGKYHGSINNGGVNNNNQNNGKHPGSINNGGVNSNNQINGKHKNPYYHGFGNNNQNNGNNQGNLDSSAENNNNQNNGNNQGGQNSSEENNNNQNNQNNQGGQNNSGGNNNNQNNGNNQGGQNSSEENNNNQNNQNNQRSSNNQGNQNNQGGNGWGNNNNNQGNQNNQRSSDLACSGPYPRPPHCGGGGNNNNQNNGNNQGGNNGGGNNNNQNNQNNQRSSNNQGNQNNQGGNNGGGNNNNQGNQNNQRSSNNQNNGNNQGGNNNGGNNNNQSNQNNQRSSNNQNNGNNQGGDYSGENNNNQNNGNNQGGDNSGENNNNQGNQNNQRQSNDQNQQRQPSHKHSQSHEEHKKHIKP